MTYHIRPFLILIMVLALLSACAAKRPVLYPNAKLNSVGSATAQADIDYCINMAATSGAASGKGKEIAKTTAQGAAIGGATGAATGAIYGEAAHGAAAGAAGGGVAGLTHAILRSDEPDPILSRFVDRCLRDKGYDPIGWK
jgi:uncharacterized protein YcfJ